MAGVLKLPKETSVITETPKKLSEKIDDVLEKYMKDLKEAVPGNHYCVVSNNQGLLISQYGCGERAGEIAGIVSKYLLDLEGINNKLINEPFTYTYLETESGQFLIGMKISDVAYLGLYFEGQNIGYARIAASNLSEKLKPLIS